MLHTPKVSVITPVYQLIDGDREPYFRQLVESIRAQTYGVEHIEHIIMDGGSTDGTVELIEEYADRSYFAHWVSEKDTGIYNAMNKGVLASQGQYLMFINSDDYLLPNGIAQSVAALERKKADYSIGDVRVEFRHAKKGKKIFEIWRASVERTLLCYCTCHQGLMLRKDVFVECGMFDETYKLAADVAHMFELYLKNKKCVRVGNIVTVFRSGGISSVQRNCGIEECVDVAMRYYGKALALSRDEIHFLLEDGTEHWFIKEQREKLYAILAKVQTQSHSTQHVKLSQELYFAILSLVFDDASGRYRSKMSLSHVVDSVWTRSKHLPFKRKYAFLLAALAKKIKLYWLIKPVRDILVAHYERKR